MKNLLLKIKWLYRNILVWLFGKRMRRQIFLEILLQKANLHWFSFPQKVYKDFCKELSLIIHGSFFCINEFRIDGIHLYINRANNKQFNTRRVPIDIDTLEIKRIGNNNFQIQLLKKSILVKKEKEPKYEVLFTNTIQINETEIEKKLWKPNGWNPKHQTWSFLHVFLYKKVEMKKSKNYTNNINIWKKQKYYQTKEFYSWSIFLWKIETIIMNEYKKFPMKQ